MIFFKKKLLNIKYVFWFSVQILSEIFEEDNIHFLSYLAQFFLE